MVGSFEATSDFEKDGPSTAEVDQKLKAFAESSARAYFDISSCPKPRLGFSYGQNPFLGGLVKYGSLNEDILSFFEVASLITPEVGKSGDVWEGSFVRCTTASSQYVMRAISGVDPITKGFDVVGCRRGIGKETAIYFVARVENASKLTLGSRLSFSEFAHSVEVPANSKEACAGAVLELKKARYASPEDLLQHLSQVIYQQARKYGTRSTMTLPSGPSGLNIRPADSASPIQKLEIGI